MHPIPALFVSHGSPILAFENRHPVHRFLLGAAAEWPRPRAIILVSAHWEASLPSLTGSARPATLHDYGGGFPYPEMYSCAYQAPGAIEAAAAAHALLMEAGIGAAFDDQRGFDHGCWAPLRLMYPRAEIPVAQLSLVAGQTPAHHFRIGRALAPLRARDILLIGSGTMTHNQRDIDRSGLRPVPEWARTFSDWMQERLADRADETILDYRRRAPHATYSHPTEEHLMPLFVALGAATAGLAPRRIHHSFTFSTQAMDAYLFR